MPLIKTLDQAVAAGATIFPWQGNQYEYLRGDALIEIAMLADTGDVWTCNVYVGPILLAQSIPLDALALAVPITYPDDFHLTDVAAGGDRIGCDLVNGTGAVADVRTEVRITFF